MKFLNIIVKLLKNDFRIRVLTEVPYSNKKAKRSNVMFGRISDASAGASANDQVHFETSSYLLICTSDNGFKAEMVPTEEDAKRTCTELIINNGVLISDNDLFY